MSINKMKKSNNKSATPRREPNQRGLECDGSHQLGHFTGWRHMGALRLVEGKFWLVPNGATACATERAGYVLSLSLSRPHVRLGGLD